MAGREHDPVSQVLMNDDLLWIIFGLAKIRPGGKLADLSNLPRVCRAFRGPATGVIWSELDGMMPLWHLLAPTKRQSYRHYAYECREKHLRSIISAKLYDVSETMARFLWYAGHTRTLKSCFMPMHVDLEAQLIDIVIQRSRGKGILTNLRTICYMVSPLSDAKTHFLRLATPTLIDLTVHINVFVSTTPTGEWVETRKDDPADIHKALDDLRRTSPDLRSISLNVKLNDALTNTLLRFSRLKSIRQVEVGSATVFTLLVTKPSLASLDLRWRDPPPDTYAANCLRRPLQCPGLVELSLRGSCSALAYLLSPLRAPILRCATLELDTEATTFWSSELRELRPADPEYPQCMRALVSAAPALEELELTVPQIWKISYSEILAPVLPVRGIRRFVFHTHGGSCRHAGVDADLAAVARAWRALEVFRVEPMSEYGPKRREGPAPTAAALAHFRALCPNLVDLMLPSLDADCGVSDADAPNGVAVAPEPAERVHPLRTLVVRLRVTQPSDITAAQRARWEAYLLRLFPLLEGMEGREKMVMGEFCDPPPSPLCYCDFPQWESSSTDSES